MSRRPSCLALLLACPLFLSCNTGIRSVDGDGGPTGPDARMAPPKCVGLQCKIPNCQGKGKGTTSISGVVNIPAGNLTLYNATDYVTNSAINPVPTGRSRD